MKTGIPFILSIVMLVASDARTGDNEVNNMKKAINNVHTRIPDLILKHIEEEESRIETTSFVKDSKLGLIINLRSYPSEEKATQGLKSDVIRMIPVHYDTVEKYKGHTIYCWGKYLGIACQLGKYVVHLNAIRTPESNPQDMMLKVLDSVIQDIAPAKGDAH